VCTGGVAKACNLGQNALGSRRLGFRRRGGDEWVFFNNPAAQAVLDSCPRNYSVPKCCATLFMHAHAGFSRSHSAFQAIFISNTPAFPGLINETKAFMNQFLLLLLRQL
jgi:hypothetical protein